MFLCVYAVQLGSPMQLTHHPMQRPRATKPTSSTGRGHTAAVMNSNTGGAYRPLVTRLISRTADHGVIPPWKKPAVHVVKKIRAVIIIVLCNRNICHRVLARGITGGIGVNRIRRANILRNILRRTAAKRKSSHNGKHNK